MEDMLFLEQLNPQQKKVCIEGSNILLKACPGSGKTRTLTYKLAYIIKKYVLQLHIQIELLMKSESGWRKWIFQKIKCG